MPPRSALVPRTQLRGSSESSGPEAFSGPCLIITGDDFGRSAEINEAIGLAHRQGILTSASLMVTGEALEAAVRMARRNPSLAIGLHVVLVDGRSALPPQEIPQLVDARGQFSASPVRAGLRYGFSAAARQQLRRELQAQFTRFAATGLPLAHVDGHLHMHLHPVVFPMVIALAERYGAGRIRVPCDRLAWSLRHDGRHRLAKLGTACALGLLGRWCRRRVRGHQFALTSRTYGLFQSGAMDEAYVLGVLGRMSESSAELYFHPTTGPRLAPLGPNPEELEVLLSLRVRDLLDRRTFRLTGTLFPTESQLPPESQPP